MKKYLVRKIRKEMKKKYWDSLLFLNHHNIFEYSLLLLEYDINHFHFNGNYEYLLKAMACLSEFVTNRAVTNDVYERIQNIRVEIRKKLINKKLKEQNKKNYKLLKKILGQIEVFSLTCNEFIDKKYDGNKLELLSYLIFSIKNVHVLENLIYEKPHMFNLMDKKAYELFRKVIESYLDAVKKHAEDPRKSFDDLCYFDDVMEIIFKHEIRHLSIGDLRNLITYFEEQLSLYTGNNQERYIYFIQKWEVRFLKEIQKKLNRSIEKEKDSLNSLCYEFSIAKDFSLPIKNASKVCCLKYIQMPRTKKMTSIYTIDSEGAKELDDGFSCQKKEDGYRLGIHIANPLLYIDFSNPIFKEATRRTSTLYFGQNAIPMYPSILSQDLFSLNAGNVRKVLSLYVDIDYSVKQIEKVEIKVEDVFVEKNDTYKNCDLIIKEQNVDQIYLDNLNNLSDVFPFLLRYFSIDKIYKYINRTFSNISNTNVVGNTKSEKMVESMMIFMNRYVALFALKNGFPFLFRNHELKNVYKEDLERYKNLLQKEKNTQAYLNEIEILKGKYPKSYYDTVCRGHFGLGIPEYSHITSPIRRIADNYNQLMLMKWLGHNTPDKEWYKYELMLKEVSEYINYQQKNLEIFSSKVRSKKYNL